jgi:Flp pilus assembly protein CpaB
VLSSQVKAVSFSNSLAKGERAFSLPVTARNTFADGISDNDRIDIMWTVGQKGQRPTKTDDGKIHYEPDVYTSTKTLLQDVKVIRVLSLRATLPPPTGGTTEGDAQKTAANAAAVQSTLSELYSSTAPSASVHDLAVTDQQSEVLKYAQDYGNGIIDLVLRSSAAVKDATGALAKDAAGNNIKGDHDVEQTTGITIDSLILKYGLLPAPKDWLVAPTP